MAERLDSGLQWPDPALSLNPNFTSGGTITELVWERDAGGPKPRRVRAIVVYPMNALANSQLRELEKFLRYGYPDGGEPRCTGQEREERASAFSRTRPTSCSPTP